jgi:hypothetical protein
VGVRVVCKNLAGVQASCKWILAGELVACKSLVAGLTSCKLSGSD